MITLFTTLALGSYAESFKRRIRLDEKGEETEINLFSRENPLVDSVLFTADTDDSEIDKEGYFKSSVVKGLKKINSQFLRPVFGKERDDDQVKKTISELKADVKRSLEKYHGDEEEDD